VAWSVTTVQVRILAPRPPAGKQLLASEDESSKSRTPDSRKAASGNAGARPVSSVASTAGEDEREMTVCRPHRP